MADVWTANYTLFKSGDIITEPQVRLEWDKWVGYPESLTTNFITKTSVSDANAYLESIELPWRISAINTVDSVRQWTIA
jgi:hypothetical protein